MRITGFENKHALFSETWYWNEICRLTALGTCFQTIIFRPSEISTNDKKFYDFCYFYSFLLFPFSPTLLIVTYLPLCSPNFSPFWAVLSKKTFENEHFLCSLVGKKKNQRTLIIPSYFFMLKIVMRFFLSEIHKIDSATRSERTARFPSAWS